MRRLAGACASLLVLGCLLSTAGRAAEEVAPKDSLQRILFHLSRVAHLYRDTALEFTCDETIRDAGLGGRTRHYAYLYLYDDQWGFKDHRLPLIQGQPSRLPVRDKLPRYLLKRGYSWAFLFSRAEQKHHRYRLVSTETALQHPAFKVHFEPIPPAREGINDWYGNAWIDVVTYQLLQVEAVNADDYKAYRDFHEKLALAEEQPPNLRSTRYTFSSVLTEFGMEKNGMRFPSKVVTKRARYRIRGGGQGDTYRSTPVFRLEQIYTNYRFFKIRTRAEIKRIVLGEARTEKRPPETIE